MTDATALIPVATARQEELAIAANPPRRALALHRELTRVWANGLGWWGFRR
ncbi:MAG: hypothetical protein ACXIU8_14125 [Alkalilacustris sp.]